MRLSSLMMLLLIVLSGCYKEHKIEIVKPADLIPRKQLVQIITDMQIVDAAAVNIRRQDGHLKQSEKAYFDVLFNHYKVSAKQIRESITYYNSQGDVMVSIYDDVLSDLSQQQSVLDNEKALIEAKKQFKSLEIEFQRLNMGGAFREDSIANLCIKP